MVSARQRDLSERFRSGDPGAMAVLVDTHGRELDSLLAKRGCSPEDRRDVAQRAWIRAFEARERLDPDRPFGAWIGRIATHLWWDDLKRLRTRRAAGEVDTATEPLGWVRAQALDALDQRQIQAAIAMLPFEQREAILLTQFEGLSIEEAADEVGIGVSGMKSRVSRGYAALRRSIEASTAEAFPERRTVELEVAGCERCEEVLAVVRSIACPSCDVSVREAEGSDGPRLVVDGQAMDGLAGSLGYAGTLRALGIGLCSTHTER